MIIADGHLDLAYNALQVNRDLLRSAYTIRVMETGKQDSLPPGWGTGMGTVALPEMRQGRVALCFPTMLAACSGHSTAHMDYPSVLQANAIARGQLAYYRNLEKAGLVRIITGISGLDSHIAEWEAWDRLEDPSAGPPPPLGFVLSMEGADPILEPGELEEWWDLGLRMLIVTHFGPGRYAGGTGTEDGLTELGIPLLREMERLGMLVDLTHFSDPAFWQVLDCYAGPVLASHTNCRALVPHQRQFSDQQIRALISRNGVIGSCPDLWMLEPGFQPGAGSNEKISLNVLVDHIDHVCQLAGNSLHAAIGSDLDGGYGQKQCPHDLETISDLQKIGQYLAARGYHETEIANILYRNWVRLLRESWTQ